MRRLILLQRAGLSLRPPLFTDRSECTRRNDVHNAGGMGMGTGENAKASLIKGLPHRLSVY